MSFNLTPKESPEIIDYHMVSRDGKTWEKRPGTLMATIHSKNPEDIDNRIEKAMLELFPLVANDNGATEKAHDCKHKLYACLYHLQTLKTEIRKQIEEFEREYTATSGVSHERENPVLIYETEAFLLQLKSSLDVLVQFMSKLVPRLSSLGGFNHKGDVSGGKVIYILTRYDFADLANLVETNRQDWIQEAVKWRDTVGHHSNLRNFHCFVESPYIGSDVIVHHPTMPNGEKVDKYCEDTFNKLLRFYSDVGLALKGTADNSQT
jgi:hypothetical protein